MAGCLGRDGGQDWEQKLWSSVEKKKAWQLAIGDVVFEQEMDGEEVLVHEDGSLGLLRKLWR